jgi:hypothetical protein
MRSVATSLLARVAHGASRTGRAVAYLTAALVILPFFYHLARGSQAYLGFFEDDYFYYSIIADKLATLGRLTYDSTTATNGFHPLWFIVIFGLRLASGGLTSAFYVLLASAFLGSMIATYELSCWFARSLGASVPMAHAIALAHWVTTCTLLDTGMETALDVPFLFWLLAEVARPRPVTPRRAAWLGFVASLAVLSRLDIALAVAMIVLGWLVLVRPAPRLGSRCLLAFSAAGVALPVYLVVNWLAFGSILPTSAAAKQLVKHWGFNFAYVRAIAFSGPFGKTVGLTLALGLVAAWTFLRRTPRSAEPRPEALFAGLVAIVFAGVFFVMNALSGWMYFGWYAYPLAPALVAALVFVAKALGPHLAESVRARGPAVLLLGMGCLSLGEAAYTFVTRGPLWSVSDNGLLAMSVELAQRMRGRQGVFGMGAIGGFVSYLLDQPLVQLEGLVADRRMVEHIRHEDDLARVLDEYHVDYLVVSLQRATLQKIDGCYVVTQPNSEWAGKRVAKMSGLICSEPVEHIATRLPIHRWSMFSTLDTYVFDVRGHAAGRPARGARGGSEAADDG